MTTQNDYRPGECHACDGLHYHLDTCPYFREELAEAYRLRRAVRNDAKRVSLDDLDALLLRCGVARERFAFGAPNPQDERYREGWQRAFLVTGTRGLSLGLVDRNDVIHDATSDDTDHWPLEQFVVLTLHEASAIRANVRKAEIIEARALIARGA